MTAKRSNEFVGPLAVCLALVSSVRTYISILVAVEVYAGSGCVKGPGFVPRLRVPLLPLKLQWKVSESALSQVVSLMPASHGSALIFYTDWI